MATTQRPQRRTIRAGTGAARLEESVETSEIQGIETAADAATLTALGVDYGQGWHFGRPGPAGDLTPTVGADRQPAQHAHR